MFNFGLEDRIDTPPSDWIFEEIERHGGDRYTTEKLSLVTTVGYGEFRIEGTFKIPASTSIDEIVLHELGVVDTLPVSDFKTYDKRFEIRSASPIKEINKGRISFVRDGTPIALTLLAKHGKTLDIPALMRTPVSVSPDHEAFKFRVDAGCIDLIANLSDQQRINFSIDVNEEGPFAQKIGLMCLMSWLEKEKSLEFQLRADSGRLFEGMMEANLGAESWMHRQALVGHHLMQLLGADKAKNIQIDHVSFVHCVAEMELAASFAGAGFFSVGSKFRGRDRRI